AEACAVDVPVVVLLELVAVHRIGEVGEVREEIEVVAEKISLRTPRTRRSATRDFSGDAPAATATPVGPIDVAEAGDEPRTDCTPWNLVRRTPAGVIAHGCECVGERLIVAAVFHEAGRTVVSLGQAPGPLRLSVFAA